MLYTYHIDKDERGEFSASVRDSKDQTVFEVNSEIFEDGFMSHKNDIEGLGKYLNDLGVICGRINKHPINTQCCPNCGNHEDFYILESACWKAYYDPETNELHAKNSNNDIDQITCKKCNHDCTELFEDITINWQ